MSNILYAPQVRAIQPAFEYNTSTKTGEMEVYFSFSPYNKLADITEIRYTIINPNLSGGTGVNNSIIKANADLDNFDNVRNIYYNTVSKEELTQNDENNKEYYFTVNFNDTGFNAMTLDQYYQLQIWLVYDNSNDEKEANISYASQVSLIRPFCGIEDFVVEGLTQDEDGSTIRIADTFSKLKGYLSPKNASSKEYLAEVSYFIKKGETIATLTKTITPFSTFDFEEKIDYIFTQGEESYSFHFTYKTINGCKGEKIYSNIRYIPRTGSDWADNCKLTVSEEKSQEVVKINLQFTAQPNRPSYPTGVQNSFITIQRSDSSTNFSKWTDITVATFKNSITGTCSYDFLDCGNIKSGETYKYRARAWSASHDIQINSPYYQSAESSLTLDNFEHLYLLDRDYLMSIQFDPKISNFKWVTQESLTNTLGGIYPIVRHNGHSYYKQFSLSGTLFFPIMGASSGTDSLDHAVNYNQDYDDGLYLHTNAYNILLNQNVDNWTDISMKQKLIRDEAMKFLTNRKPKLFRSAEEGNMIVYLSNISFTPNQTLGRSVVGFSATATEICELTEENLKKYILNSSDIKVSAASEDHTGYTSIYELWE